VGKLDLRFVNDRVSKFNGVLVVVGVAYPNYHTPFAFLLFYDWTIRSYIRKEQDQVTGISSVIVMLHHFSSDQSSISVSI
jgi:hypothetical protein